MCSLQVGVVLVGEDCYEDLSECCVMVSTVSGFRYSDSRCWENGGDYFM